MIGKATPIIRANPTPTARAHMLNADAASVAGFVIAGIEGVAIRPRILDAVRWSAVPAPVLANPTRLLSQGAVRELARIKRSRLGGISNQNARCSGDHHETLHDVLRFEARISALSIGEKRCQRTIGGTCIRSYFEARFSRSEDVIRKDTKRAGGHLPDSRRHWSWAGGAAIPFAEADGSDTRGFIWP